MKKIFRFIACISVAFCAAYGAYYIAKKFIFGSEYKETGEFDDLYEEFMAKNH